jgi:hypothetical protein
VPDSPTFVEERLSEVGRMPAQRRQAQRTSIIHLGVRVEVR